MKRTQWSVNLRNQLSSLAMECDSCEAIEHTKMTSSERSQLQSLINKAVTYIDERIKK